MSTNSEEIAALVIEITEYFETHPNAADSLEGVTSWWLRPKQKAISKQAVLQALQCLCDTNIATKSTGKTGKTIYSSAKYIQ